MFPSADARRPAARSGIALLLALFTLLCALCPIGLPASQKLGPAFNPANEAVTVRPEATALAARADAETPDPRRPAPAAVAATRPIVAAEPAAPLHPAPLTRVGAPATPFSPRAPPARA